MTNFKNFRCLPDVGFLGGVCAGVAYALEAPTWFIRFITVLCLFAGAPIVLYFLLWAIVPNAKTPKNYAEITGDE